MQFFLFFVSVREKIQFTVSLDHPVAVTPLRQQQCNMPNAELTASRFIFGLTSREERCFLTAGQLLPRDLVPKHILHTVLQQLSQIPRSLWGKGQFRGVRVSRLGLLMLPALFRGYP